MGSPQEREYLAACYVEPDTTTDTEGDDEWQPDWWPGDEEASAMNMAAAGIVLPPREPAGE